VTEQEAEVREQIMIEELALDKRKSQWHNMPCSHRYGGVGAPVGLTVFKTAGGSLGAVPGGFDSHTPLPYNRTATCMPSGVTLENQKIRTNFRKHP
jgi:hypothetical protein